jgi:integrase
MAYEKVTFKRSVLAALPAADDGKRNYYSDTDERGLILIVTSAGAKIFQLYIKHEGRPVRVTLGRFKASMADSVELPRDCGHTQLLANNPELNVKMARALAALVKIDLKSGTNPTDIKKAKRAELTLGGLFEEYVTRWLIPQKRSVATARTYFELHVGELTKRPTPKGRKARTKSPGSVNWQHRLISSITTDDIQRLIVSLATKGGSTNNANRVLTLIKAMFARAKDWGIYKGANPTDGIAKYKTKSRERFIQSDEMPRFFESLALEPNQDIRDGVLLGLFTGARKRNVLAMKWTDLNLERAIWTIPDEVTKNGDPLTLPLMPETVELLKNRKPKKMATFVFPGIGKSGHMENSRSGWDRVLDRDEVIQLAKRIHAAGGEFAYSFDDPERPGYSYLAVLLKRARAKAAEMQIDTNGARLTDLRPHDLWRTLGSWQASAGASLLVIGRSLGHKSQAATTIYSRLNIDPIRQSMETATQNMLVAAGISKGGDVVPIKKSAKNTAKHG